MELILGNAYVQKRTGRVCNITKVTDIRVQYLYNDKRRRGCQTSQFNSSLKYNFLQNFYKK